MMKRAAAVLAAMAAAAGLAASAPRAAAGDLEYYTGETLYTQCAAKDAAALRCAGYVLGVSDAQQARQGAGAPQRVCLPSTATEAQIVAAVGAYLAAHPEKRPLAAQDLVIEALAASYPCR